MFYPYLSSKVEFFMCSIFGFILYLYYLFRHVIETNRQ